VDPDVGPPVDVGAVRARNQPRRLVLVVGHERETRELDLKQRADLVEENPPGLDGVLRPRERVRQRCDRVELAVPHGHELFRLSGAGSAYHHPRGSAPASEENQSRDDRDQRRYERSPYVAANRRAVVENEPTEDGCRDPDCREDQRQCQIRGADAAALPPERRSKSGGYEQVRAREHEQRHRVEVDSLVFRAH